MAELTYKNCQSCGMPLKRDKKGGGTEISGAKSNKYCSHCYVDGEFTLTNISVDEMKEHVKGKIVESGFPKFIASFFVKNMHKLERWK